MASKRKAAKKQAKSAAKKAAPKKTAAKTASKKRTSSKKGSAASGSTSAVSAEQPSKNSEKKNPEKSPEEKSQKRPAKSPEKPGAKKRPRKKSAIVETTVVEAKGGAASKGEATAASAEAPSTKKPGRKKKKEPASKPAGDGKQTKAATTEEAKPKVEEKDDTNPRLRSQPVEVQEIDVRIARDRSSRIKPFQPRTFGPDPKSPPKPIEVRDQLNRYLGKALPLSARNRPDTVVELGIFAIFALGAKSAKAALDATKRCVTYFSDWNEFRISDAYEFVEFLQDLDIPELYDRCERVLEFVRDVYQDMNEVTLEHLREHSPEERLELLSRYQSLGPALTHYLGLAIQDFEGVIFHYSWARVGQRVGVLGRSNSPKTLCANLKKCFSGEDLLSVQVNLIELGEEICTSQRPNCKSCCLVNMCVSRKL